MSSQKPSAKQRAQRKGNNSVCRASLKADTHDDLRHSTNEGFDVIDGFRCEVRKADTLGLGGFLAEGMRVFKYLAASGQTRELIRLRDGGRSTSKVKGQCLPLSHLLLHYQTIHSHHCLHVMQCSCINMHGLRTSYNLEGEFSSLSH